MQVRYAIPRLHTCPIGHGRATAPSPIDNLIANPSVISRAWRYDLHGALPIDATSCRALNSNQPKAFRSCAALDRVHTHPPLTRFFVNGCGGRSRMIATPHPCRCLALLDQIMVRLDTSVARVDCHLACVFGRTVGQIEREAQSTLQTDPRARNRREFLVSDNVLGGWWWW